MVLFVDFVGFMRIKVREIEENLNKIFCKKKSKSSHKKYKYRDLTFLWALKKYKIEKKNNEQKKVVVIVDFYCQFATW